ncbi:MAG: hypothetical protein ACTILZ_06360 [Leuconostoc mesenteroides]
MRKITILASTFAIATTIGFSTVTSVSADTNNSEQTSTNQINQNQNTIQKYDKYVSVKDNQYVFNQPKEITISENDLLEIKTDIDQSNTYIRDNKLTINAETKTATQIIPLNNTSNTTMVLRSYGKNGVLQVRWNSVRIGLDKGLVNDILHAGLQGGATYLGFLAGGPGAAAAGAVVATIIDRHLDTKSGWWFDYNFFTGNITGFGRQ